MSSLRRAAWLLLVGFGIHNLDHIRRGVGQLRAGVIGAGSLAAVLVIAALALVFIHHPSAPAVAAVVGLSTAFGVAAVHLLPDWLGTLSDSLPDGDVDAATWIAVLAEIAGALGLGLAALRILHRNEYRTSIADW